MAEPGARDHRVVVVAQHHHQVVERVVAPHPLGAGRVGQLDRAVVGRVVRRVAPAVVRRDRRDRQARSPGAGRGRAGRARGGSARRRPARRRRPRACPPPASRRPAQGAAHRRPAQLEPSVGGGGEDHQTLVRVDTLCAGGRQTVHGSGPWRNARHPAHRRRRRGPSRGPGRTARCTEEFTPTEAATAGEGVAAAKTGRPDLILLDVDLPDIDGREACRLMRQAGRHRAGDHADRRGRRRRHHPGPRRRRQRLCHQALQVRRAAGPHPRPAAQPRALRGRGLPPRALRVPPGRQAAGRRARARRSG